MLLRTRIALAEVQNPVGGIISRVSHGIEKGELRDDDKFFPRVGKDN